tara:strand:- start:1547 stop:2101 length:555 start_codon:yes stop_codon:yes gene_type:complete
MKDEIRDKLTISRNSLDDGVIKEKSKQIEKSLFSLEEYKNSKNVMFYVSFGNEVETHDMIKKALKDKVVIVPKVVFGEIKPSLLGDFSQLIPCGKFDILEPMEPVFYNAKNIDLVVVPGIGFDRKGVRVGYGYGFYDKFLKNLPKAVKIGVGYDFQVVDEIQKENHDVSMDLIVTDKEVINCKE